MQQFKTRPAGPKDVSCEERSNRAKRGHFLRNKWQNLPRAKSPWSPSTCLRWYQRLQPKDPSGSSTALFTKCFNHYCHHHHHCHRINRHWIENVIWWFTSDGLLFKKAASSNWFHRMTLLSGGADQLKPGAALDQVDSFVVSVFLVILVDFHKFWDEHRAECSGTGATRWKTFTKYLIDSEHFSELMHTGAAFDYMCIELNIFHFYMLSRSCGKWMVSWHKWS